MPRPVAMIRPLELNRDPLLRKRSKRPDFEQSHSRKRTIKIFFEKSISWTKHRQKFDSQYLSRNGGRVGG